MQGYEDEITYLARKDNQGKLRIETEKWNIPTAGQTEKNVFKSETVKEHKITRHNDKNQFKSETIKENIPTRHNEKNRFRV